MILLLFAFATSTSNKKHQKDWIYFFRIKYNVIMKSLKTYRIHSVKQHKKGFYSCSMINECKLPPYSSIMIVILCLSNDQITKSKSLVRYYFISITLFLWETSPAKSGKDEKINLIWKIFYQKSGFKLLDIWMSEYKRAITNGFYSRYCCNQFEIKDSTL